MFRKVPLSIIRSLSLYTQQWYMSYRFVDSLRSAGSGRKWLGSAAGGADLYDIYHCCVYSEKLLMMDRGTVRNMKFYSKNKFEKLVHLVGFIIRVRGNDVIGDTCHIAVYHKKIHTYCRGVEHGLPC